MTKLNYETLRFNERARKVYYPDKQDESPLRLNGPNYVLKFGKYRGTKLKDVPLSYIEWAILNFTDSRADMFAREYERREKSER